MKGRKLLMIPGPIEFDPAVMQAMGEPTTSHVASDFIEAFGQALDRMCQTWLAPDGQPFVVAGSGTLAMDMAVANLVEPGDRALVINTGYFSDRMAAILQRYGAEVDQVRAPVGDRPSMAQVEAALSQANYKVLTITHVDTSTGVIADLENWAKLSCQWETLTIVDGVCSVAGEELRQKDWCIDVVLTASQKAVGVPPGLALLVAGPKAMEAFRRRRYPVANYYADWSLWLPIMEAYRARKPAYFGTPPVNLISALNVSLGQILDEGLETRFERHRRMSRAIKAAIRALGMDQVPVCDQVAANTLTAPRYPRGVDASFLGHVQQAGAILAGGLHPEIKGEYFRIGHMGVTGYGDLLATIGALEQGLMAVGYDFAPGAGLAAAQAMLLD
ncbi:MAG: pyridoxal-phosphate-dependent aminotransferase family protein [Chloroflexota bacterium]